MNAVGLFGIIIAATAMLATAAPPAVISADWTKNARRVANPAESKIADIDPNTLELTTRVTPSSPWLAQLVLTNTADVQAGDVLIVEAELRAAEVDPETHESALQIAVQSAEPPFAVDDEAVVLATDTWQKHTIPLRLDRTYPAGKLQLSINFGVCRQRVQLRNVSLRNLGPRESLAGLRSPPLTYAGREPDAPWRKLAAERIEKIRKADLSILVLDEHGKPIPGAAVRVEQKKHDFAFGTAVTKDRILGTTADDEQYRQVLQRYFNTAVFENDLKWPSWERDDPATANRHREQMHAAINWLKSDGRAFVVRGHCLVWPEMQRLPSDAQALLRQKDAAGLRRRLDGHVSQIVREFAGKIDEWDVLNEAVFHRSIQDLLGDREVVRWFSLAHQADPKATLYLNDFAMLSYGALNPQKTQRMYELAKSLREQGAPIQAIGEQAHFGDILVSPQRMLSLFDQFATLELPIRITEFDVAVDDEQLQADYLRDFYTAAFSHPAVNGIVLWGFYQRNHWRPQAALWRNDWTRRPLGDAYAELVEKVWHTSATGTSGEDGRVAVRGFMGEYEISVSHGERTEKITCQLPRSGAAVTVRFRSTAD